MHLGRDGTRYNMWLMATYGIPHVCCMLDVRPVRMIVHGVKAQCCQHSMSYIITTFTPVLPRVSLKGIYQRIALCEAVTAIQMINKCQIILHLKRGLEHVAT